VLVGDSPLICGLDLLQVGTAKVNTESSSISKVRKDATFRRQRAIDSGIMHGTVPYLGSFLTDLTYLHTAKPDYLEVRFVTPLKALCDCHFTYYVSFNLTEMIGKIIITL